jgi:hypothetical protein
MKPKKKVKTIDFYEQREKCHNELIQGAFVIAYNLQKKLVAIKLIEIKSIEFGTLFENHGYDSCYFNTYKDHKYYTEISATYLISVINKIISKENKND